MWMKQSEDVLGNESGQDLFMETLKLIHIWRDIGDVAITTMTSRYIRNREIFKTHFPNFHDSLTLLPSEFKDNQNDETRIVQSFLNKAGVADGVLIADWKQFLHNCCLKVFDKPFEVNLIVQDEQMTFLLVADWESKNHAIIFIFTKLLPAFKYFLVAHIASSLERTYKRSFDKAVITAFNARTRVYLLLCKTPATTDETDKIFSHKSDPNKDLFEQFVEKFKKVGSNSRQNVKIITLEDSEDMCCYNLDHSLQPSTQTRKNVSELFKTIQPMAEKNRIAFLTYVAQL